MGARAASWLAWVLVGLCVTVFLAGVVLYVLLRSTQDTRVPSAMSDSALIRLVVFNVPFQVFPVVGALVASRRPRNAIGWICLAIGFLASGSLLSGLYVAYGTAGPGSVLYVAMVVAVTYWAWVLPVGLMGTYLLLFPDGRLPSGRWRPLAWLSVLSGALQATDAEVVGANPADRTPLGLWPSDHAGVVAKLRLLSERRGG